MPALLWDGRYSAQRSSTSCCVDRSQPAEAMTVLQSRIKRGLWVQGGIAAPETIESVLESLALAMECALVPFCYFIRRSRSTTALPLYDAPGRAAVARSRQSSPADPRSRHRDPVQTAGPSVQHAWSRCSELRGLAWRLSIRQASPIPTGEHCNDTPAWPEFTARSVKARLRYRLAVFHS